MTPLRALVASLVLAATSFAAAAQDWPNRPIHFIVPYPAGGSTDLGARVVGDYLARSLGQQVVVENKSGASGNVGFEYGAKAAPDGYTVTIAPDQVTSAPHVFGKVGFDPLKDYVSVILLSKQPVVLAVHPSLEVNTLAELIALVKQKPGAPLIPHYNAGKLKLLAQSMATRSSTLPNVPTYREGGVDLALDQWLGALAPAGTPPAIVARLNAEMNKALREPSVREAFLKSAQEPVGGTAEEFAKLMRDDFARYERLTKDLNIRVTN